MRSTWAILLIMQEMVRSSNDRHPWFLQGMSEAFFGDSLMQGGLRDILTF